MKKYRVILFGNDGTRIASWFHVTNFARRDERYIAFRDEHGREVGTQGGIIVCEEEAENAENR